MADDPSSRGPTHRSPTAVLFRVYQVALLGAVALVPSTASAAEGTSVEGLVWLVLGTIAVQFLISLISGIIVVVVRERVAAEANRISAIEQRLQETREQYATREQLKDTAHAMSTLRQEVLEDVRREMDLRIEPLAAKVETMDRDLQGLRSAVDKVELATLRVLDILDPDNKPHVAGRAR